jgi:hypothetical protein
MMNRLETWTICAVYLERSECPEQQSVINFSYKALPSKTQVQSFRYKAFQGKTEVQAGPRVD